MTDLRDQIARFCAARQISLSAFGRMAIGDSRLVKELAGGRVLHHETHVRIVEFMRRARMRPPRRAKKKGMAVAKHPAKSAQEPQWSVFDDGRHQGSKDLLKALWDHHSAILTYARNAGRNVADRP
jgi:hypothetical protein